MCCAIANPIMPLKMELIEAKYSPFKLSSKLSTRKAITIHQAAAETCSNNTDSDEGDFEADATEIKETDVDAIMETHEKSDRKKKKKWKSVPLTDFNFKTSLFPRPMRPELVTPELEENIFNKIEAELAEFEATLAKWPDFDKTPSELLEGNVTKNDKLARNDKHRRIRKAGRQVKDKYCTSVRNNKGRRKLFIHHRLYKLINLEEKRLCLHLPSRSKYNDYGINNSFNKSTNETRSKLKPAPPIVRTSKRAPTQNLRFALQTTNAGGDLGIDLVSMLINLQHRDLTPEDYETLLRLDESVAPKTIDKSTLDSFRTDVVTAETAGDICAVCMEPYEVGQARKFLPCNHVFHAKCIDMWLENSSRNCPIDGLPIDEQS